MQRSTAKIHQEFPELSLAGMSASTAATEIAVALSVAAFAELVVSSVVLSITMKLKLWRKPANLLFINMLILRVIDSSVVVPLYIARSQLKLQGYENQFVCIASRLSFYLVFRMAPINMCMIALSRAFSVRSPFFFNRIATTRRFLVVIAMEWLIILGLQIVPLFTMNSNDFSKCKYGLDRTTTLVMNVLFVPVPLFITMICYIIIFTYMVRALMERTRMLTAVNPRQARKTRSGIMFSLILLSFILCYWPFTIYQFIQLVCPTCITDAFDKSVTGRRVALALRAFCHLDGIVSSLLYSWMQLAIVNHVRSKWNSIFKSGAQERYYYNSTYPEQVGSPAEKHQLLFFKTPISTDE